jgi:hypothetical protein
MEGGQGGRREAGEVVGVSGSLQYKKHLRSHPTGTKGSMVPKGSMVSDTKGSMALFRSHPTGTKASMVRDLWLWIPGPEADHELGGARAP